MNQAGSEVLQLLVVLQQQQLGRCSVPDVAG
jgi:hypothetical protein